MQTFLEIGAVNGLTQPMNTSLVGVEKPVSLAMLCNVINTGIAKSET
jgi:hypothetical protein